MLLSEKPVSCVSRRVAWEAVRWDVVRCVALTNFFFSIPAHSVPALHLIWNIYFCIHGNITTISIINTIIKLKSQFSEWLIICLYKFYQSKPDNLMFFLFHVICKLVMICSKWTQDINYISYISINNFSWRHWFFSYLLWPSYITFKILYFFHHFAMLPTNEPQNIFDKSNVIYVIKENT